MHRPLWGDAMLRKGLFPYNFIFSGIATVMYVRAAHDKRLSQVIIDYSIIHFYIYILQFLSCDYLFINFWVTLL